MQTVILYDSRFGNTEAIARAIARGAARHSSVTVLHAGDAQRDAALAAGADLVLVGGPTHNHRPSAGLKALASLLSTRVGGGAAGCFDTRYRGPVLLMGSGAAATAKVLSRAGVDLVAPPESFFIVRKGSVATQVLEPAEVERAEAWGRDVAVAAASRLESGTDVVAG